MPYMLAITFQNEDLKVINEEKKAENIHNHYGSKTMTNTRSNKKIEILKTFLLEPEVWPFHTIVCAFTLKARLPTGSGLSAMLRVRLRTVTLINRGGRSGETPGINGTRIKQ